MSPPVPAEGESIRDLFLSQNLTNGVCYEERRHIGADLSGKYNLAAQIQHSTQVKHTDGNGDIDDIRHPESIGMQLIEIALELLGISPGLFHHALSLFELFLLVVLPLCTSFPS